MTNIDQFYQPAVMLFCLQYKRPVNPHVCHQRHHGVSSCHDAMKQFVQIITGNTKTSVSLGAPRDGGRTPAAPVIFHRAASVWPVLWLSGFTASAGCSPPGSPKVSGAGFALSDLSRISGQRDSKIYRRSYPGAAAVDDVIGSFVDLALHLDRLLLVLGHFDPEDPEVRTSEIQSDEVALFCWVGETTNTRRKAQLGNKVASGYPSRYRVLKDIHCTL